MPCVGGRTHHQVLNLTKFSVTFTHIYSSLGLREGGQIGNNYEPGQKQITKRKYLFKLERCPTPIRFERWDFHWVSHHHCWHLSLHFLGQRVRWGLGGPVLGAKAAEDWLHRCAQVDT